MFFLFQQRNHLPNNPHIFQASTFHSTNTQYEFVSLSRTLFLSFTWEKGPSALPSKRQTRTTIQDKAQSPHLFSKRTVFRTCQVLYRESVRKPPDEHPYVKWDRQCSTSVFYRVELRTRTLLFDWQPVQWSSKRVRFGPVRNEAQILRDRSDGWKSGNPSGTAVFTINPA